MLAKGLARCRGLGIQYLADKVEEEALEVRFKINNYKTPNITFIKFTKHRVYILSEVMGFTH